MSGRTEPSVETQEMRDMRAALTASDERLRGVMDTAVNAIIIISEACIIETIIVVGTRVIRIGGVVQESQGPPARKRNRICSTKIAHGSSEGHICVLLGRRCYARDARGGE